MGSEFCGPESPALRDPNIWVVTVGKCLMLLSKLNSLTLSELESLYCFQILLVSYEVVSMSVPPLFLIHE